MDPIASQPMLSISFALHTDCFKQSLFNHDWSILLGLQTETKILVPCQVPSQILQVPQTSFTHLHCKGWWHSDRVKSKDK